MLPISRSLRFSAIAALVGALGLTTAAPAHAAAYTYRDLAGDVVALDESPAGGAVDPARASGDVIGTTLTHASKQVTIVLRLRAALPARDYFVSGEIRTPKTSYDVTLARVGTTPVLGLSKTGSEKQLRCSGLRGRANAKVVSISVPRTCLGSPSAVRIGVGVSTLDGDVTYADDALRRGVGADLTLSPRLRRG